MARLGLLALLVSAADSEAFCISGSGRLNTLATKRAAALAVATPRVAAWLAPACTTTHMSAAAASDEATELQQPLLPRKRGRPRKADAAAAEALGAIAEPVAEAVSPAAALSTDAVVPSKERKSRSKPRKAPHVDSPLQPSSAEPAAVAATAASTIKQQPIEAVSDDVQQQEERRAAEASLLRRADLTQRLDTLIDDFLSGEYTGFKPDSPKPRYGQAPAEVVAIVLEALRSESSPSPYHGAAVSAVLSCDTLSKYTVVVSDDQIRPDTIVMQ
jgi:hypothetical protein